MKTIDPSEAVTRVEQAAATYASSSANDPARSVQAFMKRIDKVLKEPAVKQADYLQRVAGRVGMHLAALEMPDPNGPDRLTQPSHQRTIAFYRSLLAALQAHSSA